MTTTTPGQSQSAPHEELAARIAGAFVQVLRECLTPEEWDAMAAANRSEEHADVCHSHDYCDANVAMAEAFRRLGLDEPDANNDSATWLWNRAWTLASPVLRGEEANDAAHWNSSGYWSTRRRCCARSRGSGR